MRKDAPGGRDSSLELLRIFAMLLVVASHLPCHAMGDGWKMWELPFCANQAWSIALGRWGTFGVELFIIISSYFMCGRRGIRSRKIFDLAFQTLTTCVAFFFFIRLTGLNMVGRKALLQEALELFTARNYWFIPAYIVFYALLPFLQLVSAGGRGRSLRLAVVWTLLSLVFRFYAGWWIPFFGRVGRFVYLYFLTAALKEAEDGDGRHFVARHAGAGTLVCYALLVFEACWSRRKLSQGQGAFTLYVGEYITLYLEFSLFYLFKRMRIKRSRALNTVAGTVFGVYLLHENFLWMSWKDHERFSILWDQLLGAGVWWQSPLFPAYCALAPLLVFAACSAAELALAFLRRLILSRLRWPDALCNRIDGWYAALFREG